MIRVHGLASALDLLNFFISQQFLAKSVVLERCGPGIVVSRFLQRMQETHFLDLNTHNKQLSILLVELIKEH
jgi:hypothetical protein